MFNPTKKKYIDSDGQELTKETLVIDVILYINKKGIVRRLDGPAVSYPSGTKVWYKNGNRHREDVPAYIGSDGQEKYYLEGKEVSKKDIDLIWLKRQVEECQ